MLRDWFASLEVVDRNRLANMACCSNPNVQMYTDGNGVSYLRCANCACKV